MSDIYTFMSDGVEIAYIDTGREDAGLGDAGLGDAGRVPASRATPVLLIHGFASNLATNWVHTGWVAALREAGYRVIAFDHRGHGRSAKPYGIEDYGAPIMAEDARRLLDHLAIPRAHLIGYSMGARVATFLTLNHPDRVASATLAGLGANLVQGMRQRGDVIAESLEAPSLESVTNPEGRMFRAFAEQTGSDLRALAACMRSARVRITAEDVGGIRCPVLVVVGTADTVAGSPADLAALIPGGRWFAPEGRDHMRTVGDRGFRATTLAFLDEIG